MKIIGDSLRKNPSHLFRSTQRGEELLYSLKTVYPGVSVIISKELNFGINLFT